MKEKRSLKKDIAIIGISGKFSQSENIEEFWKNLTGGKELVHFHTDEELRNLGIEEDLISNKNYIKTSSLVSDSGSFDHAFFGYTREDAESMEPQIRILHEQAWLSLEDAGYNPSSLNTKVGCYFSAGDDMNWRAHVLLSNNEEGNSYLARSVSKVVSISTLISYSLNLRGPSYYLDTACSSSLVAVHVACRSLLLKECSMALAGGVNVRSTKDIGYMHEKDMIYSKDGHCKAFDIDSSGTFGGEGVGVVVLKRLEDALMDRDHIYAVIRATSVNNDGNQKIGYTAPSVTGQYECIRSAHQIAGIDPESISYIETHGTGTRLGDSVEIEALNKAFNYNTKYSCGIGSLKTNIGHLDAAAGIAGLIKTTLALKHRTIPPSLHFTSPNPEVNFKSGPFYVNTELKKWDSDDILLAGVSSLGIGGTNAHVIVEEPPLLEKQKKTKSYELLLFSAKTKSSVDRYHSKLKEFIEKNVETDLSDLACTLKTGRSSFKYRKFIVGKNREDILSKLESFSTAQQFQAGEKREVVFMFAGQGSQYFEMGKQIYNEYPYFRSVVDEGLTILKNETGKDYSGIIGYSKNESDKDLLTDIIYTHPLLFLLEYSFARLLLHWGIKPVNMIGYSLGEYVAACISEVFSLEDGLRLVLKRAVLMNKMETGAMLSVALSADKLSTFLIPDLSIAAVNSVDSCVVSGTLDNIDLLAKQLDSNGISNSIVRASHAFHSYMMDGVIGAYKEELDKIKFSEPKYTYVSCITGESIKNSEATSSDYWSRHLREMVNFSKGLSTLLAGTGNIFIEIGSGKTLSNFLRQNQNYKQDLILTGVLRHPKEIIDDGEYLLNTLGLIWSSGVEINWTNYYSDEIRNKVSAPAYSFDKIIFTSKVDPMKKIAELSSSQLSHKIMDHYTDWIYEHGWKEIKNEASNEIKYDWTICFIGNDDFSDKLKHELESKEDKVIFVKAGNEYLYDGKKQMSIDPADLRSYEKIFSEVAKQFSGTGRIIHAWSLETIDNLSGMPLVTEEMGYFSLLNIARAFSKNKNLDQLYIDFLAVNLFKVIGNEKTFADQSIALAALKIIPKEFDKIYCKCIAFQKEDLENKMLTPETIFSKLDIHSRESIIALRGNKSWKPFYEKIEISGVAKFKSKFKKQGLYLITGANGGMGRAIAAYLIKEYNASLILIGRSDPDFEILNDYKNPDNSIEYIKDDLGNGELLKTKIDNAQLSINKKLDGVFHTAGVGDYSGLITDRTKENCEDIFLPKIRGTNHLYEAIDHQSLDFFVLFSSSSSVIAPFGQVGYVAANMYQNYFAHMNAGKSNIVSIQWDVWREAGMAIAANRHHNSVSADEPLSYGLSNMEGMEVLNYAISSGRTEIIVSMSDFNTLVLESQERTLKKYLELADKAETYFETEIERPELNTNYVEAATETEKKISEIWKSIFGYEKIGIKDDFFELGGDSLKAMTVLRRMHKSLNVEISLGDFFNKSTIEKLACEVDTANDIKELNTPVKQASLSNQIRI